MRITDAQLGQNLQRARCLRGLTQVDLARAVGVDHIALSRVEAGTRGLAATELATIASILGVRVDHLLQPALPRWLSPNLARILLRAGPVSANDEPQLSWFVDLVEQAAAAPSASPLPVLSPRLDRLPPGAAGEIGARATRRRLGLGPVSPVVALSALLHRCGVLVVMARLPSASRLAGCAITLSNQLSAILVNANPSPDPATLHCRTRAGAPALR